jgi:broad specificity phosphatase PhoE
VSLWLVRHADSEWPAGTALGHADPGLSSDGLRTSEALAARFATEHLDRIVASDLDRARQTAQRIAVDHGLEVEVWPELREVDFGNWEGRQLADVWVEDPAAAARWEADLRSFPPGFGETFHAFERRVRGAYDRLLRAAPADVLVVSHGGTMRVLISLLGAVTYQQAWTEDLAPGAIREVAWPTAPTRITQGDRAS